MSRFPPETPFINPCFRQMGARRNMFARLKTALTLQSLGVPNRSEDEQISASPKPFSGFDLNKHPINQQLQCKIFKLSLEIRLLIYEQLIKAWAPGDGYHIVDACEVRYMSKDDKGLTFVPCDCPSTATINHQLGSERSDFHSWNLHDIRRLEWRETCKSPATYGWATNRLAILLSCRRIYSEVIEVLYSSKIFDLAGFEVTHRFISTIAPQSLDKIRFLNLTSIQVPLFYTTAQVPERLSRNIREQNEFLNKHRLAEVKWMEICSSLGSMKSLKSLRIKIDNSALVVLEGPFLRPLMAIGVEGGSFMVEVPHNFRIGTPHTPDISGKDDKISFKIERSSPPGLVKNNQAKARPSIWKADIEGKGSGYAAECREYCSCVPQPNPYRQV